MMKVEVTYYPIECKTLPLDERIKKTTTFRIAGSDTKRCLDQALKLAEPLALGSNTWITGYTYIAPSGNEIYSVSYESRI